MRGQVMLITVLVLSGTILGATAIAGLLMIYQVRQSTDIMNSTKAIYAADSGIEWRLYKFFKTDFQVCKNCSDPVDPGGACPQPAMLNISGSQSPIITSCATFGGVATTTVIKATGNSGNTSRAFEIILAP